MDDPFSVVKSCRLFAFSVVLLFGFIIKNEKCFSQTQELLSNGNFQTPYNASNSCVGSWCTTGNFTYNSTFPSCYSCPGYAWLAQTTTQNYGQPGNNLVGTIYQWFNMPQGVSSLKLNFYYNITTSEITNSSIFDSLSVSILDSNNNTVFSVNPALSNLNAVTSVSNYQLITFTTNISSNYQGKKLKLVIRASTDAGLPTTFRVDDVSLTPLLYGSVSATITPQCASNSGATWNLDGSGNYSSGFVKTNVSIGSHTVGFNSLNGFSTPPSQTLSVINNNTSTTSGTYSYQGGEELINNGNFSLNSDWNTTGYFQTVQNSSYFTNYHSPYGYAYFTDFSGYPANNISGTLSQNFTVPPCNSGGIKLSFWYRITTSETSITTAYDTCSIRLIDTNNPSNNILIAVLSNLDKNTIYTKLSVNIPSINSSTWKIEFKAVNDSYLPTVFRIDDVSILSNSINNCITWLNNAHPPQIIDEAMNKLCSAGIISNSQDTFSISNTVSYNTVAGLIGRALLGIDTSLVDFMDNFPNLYPFLNTLSPTQRRYMKLMMYLEYPNKISPSIGTDGIAPFQRDHFFFNPSSSINKGDAIKALLEAWNISPFMSEYDATSNNYTSSICDIEKSNINLGWIQQAKNLHLLDTIIATPCGQGSNINFGTDGPILLKEFYVLLAKLLNIYHPSPFNYNYYFIPNQFSFSNLKNSGGLEKGVFQNYEKSSFNIPSGGLPLEFQYSYHSNLCEIPTLNGDNAFENTYLKHKLQPLGGGWTHNYNSYIKILADNSGIPDRMLIYWSDGSIHSYLPNQSKYETKGITDVLSIDSSSSLGIPALVRIRKGRTVYTYRSIDHGAYLVLSLSKIEDGVGNHLDFEYITGYSATYGVYTKLLYKVTDSYSGRFLTFSYQPYTNYLESVTDPTGRTLHFYVNQYNHDLDSSRDANQNTTAYSYVEEVGTYAYRTHLLKTITRPKGNVITNQYITRKLLNSSSTNYQISVSAVPNYSSSLIQQSSTVTVNQNSQQLTTTYHFDQSGNVLGINTPNKNLVQQFDTLNRITVERDNDLGYITKYQYDVNGYVNKYVMIDSIHNDSIKYEYVNNNYGEVTKLKDYNQLSSSTVETNIYRNNAGQPTQIVTFENAANEVKHQFFYQYNGLLYSYVSPENFNTQYEYNSFGNVSKIKKLPKATGGQPLSESFLYDNVSRVTEHDDYNGDKTTYSYTNNDNVIDAIIDPYGLHLTTHNTYDANDNLKTITSPKGHITTLSYDFNTDDLIEENDGTDKKRWAYNEDGSLDSFINKNGNYFKYQYNTQVGLQGLLDNNGTSYFHYDTQTKNLSWINDTTGKYNYFVTYGLWNKPTLVNSQYTFSSPDFISYNYDRLKRLTHISYPNFGNINFGINYNYNDSSGNLETIQKTNSSTKYAKYTYQKDHKPILAIFGNGDTTHYHYDAFNRLDSMWAINKYGQLIYGIGAILDNNGKHAGENLILMYQGQQEMSLPILNIGQYYSYNYQQRNRINSGNGQTFTSDNAGNITSSNYPPINCTWSHYGQLKTINRNGNNTIYEYDALGFRKRNNSTYYVVDQENTGNVLMEATQNTTPISTYVWGNGLIARINPQNDSTYYYHCDFRGSVIAITNQDGQVVKYYKYDEYGKVYKSGGNLTWNNPYQYLGKHGVQTDDSDLYYMKARYYQPSTGRFISEDPKWNTNLFVYGECDPINNIDPNGQEYEFLSNFLANRKWFYDWANSSNGEAVIPTLEYFSKGNFVGTQYAEQAQSYYQSKYTESVLNGKPNSWYLLGYGVSSLWTPDNYQNSLGLFTLETEFNGELLTKDIGKTGYLKILDMRTSLGKSLKKLNGLYDGYETTKEIYKGYK